MRGSTWVFLIVLMSLLLGSTIVPAQQLELMLTVERAIGPGRSIVRFDGIVYIITTRGNYRVTFEKIDNRYHKMNVRPMSNEPQPYYDISIQWGMFPANQLSIESPGGGSYTLDTETGYAEK